MSQQKIVSNVDPDVEAQAEIVKEIKNNITSLKTSIDKILNDMNGIRSAKLEILDKVDCVKNDNATSNEQIQLTLEKAKRIMNKYEENRRKLEIVLKKLNDFNYIHTFTNVAVPRDSIDSDFDKNANVRGKNIDVQHNSTLYNINSGQEKIRLHLLDNNKYMLTAAESNSDDRDEFEKDKSDFKWGRDSAFKELQWIVKMKLYKLRHHYDRLPYDQGLEERVSLPLSCRRMVPEHA